MHFVGNTMIDTLVALEDRFRAAGAAARLGVEPGGYLLVTLHRPALVDGELLAETVRRLAALAGEMPVVFPVHPRTRKTMEAIESEHPGLQLCEPLGYVDFLSLLADAGAVLTDSGGIQEETTYLGVPCFTLRDNTERPVTIRAGTNTLLGLDPAAIAGIPAALAERPAKPPEPPPLWDGHAAERIADVLLRLNPDAAGASVFVTASASASAATVGLGLGLCCLRRLFARRQHHAHVAPFLQRLGLDHGEPVEVLEEPLQQRPAALGVGLLAAAEHDRDLDLVVLAQEALDVALLGLVVVVGDLRPQLDLADVDLRLVLAGRLLLLLLLVLVLRVVEQAGDRRLRVRARPRPGRGRRSWARLQRFGGLDDAELLAVGADQAHFGHADALVDPRRVALGRTPIEPARNRH